MQKHPINKFVFAIAVVLLAISFMPHDGTNSASPPRGSVTPHTAPNSVTLRAAPGNTNVQMFDELRDGLDVKVTTFPDGMKCTKASDLLRYGYGDTAMFFYKLNCGGTLGYVNADWTR